MVECDDVNNASTSEESFPLNEACRGMLESYEWFLSLERAARR